MLPTATVRATVRDRHGIMASVGRPVHCWLVIAAALAPAIARADDIATDEDVCRGKAEGTPCTHDHGSGTCRSTTCPSIDYSTRPPGSKDRPCSKCLPPSPASEADTTPASTSDPKTGTKADTKPGPASGPAAAPSAGCAIDPTAGTLGSLLLGLGLVALARRGATR